MNRLGFACACLLLAAGPLVAASPDPKTLAVPPADMSRARELVKKLASEDFEDREGAQEQLAKMGRLAFPALLEGMNGNPSAEVRFRCQELLPRAARLDLEARIDTFLADRKGQYEHDLPGWNEFRKVTGNTPAARTVFTELLDDPDNRGLLMAVGGPPEDLGGLVAARKTELYQQRLGRVVAGGPVVERRQPTAADVVALVFAESQVSARHVATPRTVSMSVLFSTSGVNAAISNGDEKADVYKAVAGHWIDTRDDALSMYHALTIGNNLGLSDQVLRLAVRLAALKSATGIQRSNAIMAIVRQEARQHLGVLEGLLADEGTVTNRIRVVGGQQMRDEIQVRDVALVACLQLTDQDPEDYGFVSASRNAGSIRLSYSNWTIPPDERPAALAKWKAWRAEHPDAGKKGGSGK